MLLLFTMILFFALQNKAFSLGEKKNILKSQMLEIEARAQELGEQEILALSKKAKYFLEVLQAHQLSSQFFEFLKASCHLRVRFTGLDLSLENYRAALSGETESFQTLAEQLISLKENKNIQDLEVSGISLNPEGKVIFQLSFSFLETVLK